nr:uncharacterized protein LOC123757801 [Procambarus clarkii]
MVRAALSPLTVRAASLSPRMENKDCFHGEYCREQQACTCQRDFVREPGGACLALRRVGEPCRVDQQCSRLDPRLLCHHGRCNCPQGAKRSDGACLHQPDASPPPTRGPARMSPPAYSVAAPVLICLLIFVSFLILIYTTAYHFRLQRRRLAARDNADGENAALPPSHAPVVNTTSDAPPPYSSLTPPSYEQATQLAPSTSFRTAPPPLIPITRTQSDTAIMERAPLTSPDGSSAVSYGSGLTLTSPISRSASDLPARQ